MSGTSTGRQLAANMLLASISIVISLILIETGYRIFGAYPFNPESQIDPAKDVTQFDPEIGWKGVPSARAQSVTKNARVWLELNRLGHRDIEPERRSANKPAVVFLGDSFTWGYEVAFDEMFVNRIRNQLDDFEVYNLAHRGYGTDQSLLAFRRWQRDRPLEAVFLVFYENDIDENNSDFQYGKNKPKFEIVDDELVLGNVPLAPPDGGDPNEPGAPAGGMRWKVRSLLFRSHLFSDVHFRVDNALRRGFQTPRDAQELRLTARLIEELRNEVNRQGGRFAVIAIPHKAEILGIEDSSPYQESIAKICADLEIDYLDLAPFLRDSEDPPYYRAGGHWTKSGHEVAAKAILQTFDFDPP